MQVVTNYTFEKLRRIDGGDGRNSMGVWLANDPQLDGQVAVKEIAKSDFPDPSEFFDEAKRMFASDHPNVVPIRLGSQSADAIYLVMPYFNNGSLATKVRNGPLPVQEVRKIGREILQGVGAIHAGNSIHLDIKPTNVLFGRRGEALVADLGQARTMTTAGFAPLPNRLYLPHLPPECMAGGVAGVQADIYQVGLTLYRCLNGEESFSSQLNQLSTVPNLQAATSSGDFPKRDGYLPHVSLSLRRVINKAMHPDLSKRYQSAFEFSNGLAQVSLKHDWKTITSPSGEIEWRAERKRQADLMVKLSQDPNVGSRWAVEWFTCNGTRTRRTLPNMSLDGVTRRQAMLHLRQSFQTLERA